MALIRCSSLGKNKPLVLIWAELVILKEGNQLDKKRCYIPFKSRKDRKCGEDKTLEKRKENTSFAN